VAYHYAVDNDFHREGKIFELFDNLEVKNLDETLEIPERIKELNGTAETNGVAINGTTNGEVDVN
jgi:hypothetical protein